MIRIPPTTSPRSILLSVPENTAPFAGTGASAASREARRSRLSRNEVVPGLFAPPVEKGQSHDASETVGAEQTARSTESAVSARESERLAQKTRSVSVKRPASDSEVVHHARFSNLVWSVITSKYWGIAMLTLSALIVFARPIQWFALAGPGDRDHTPQLAPYLILATMIVHVLSTVVYHILARFRLKSGVQQMFLRRLLYCETGVILAAFALVIPVFLEGFETRGPNRTEFIRSGFQIRMTPASGLLGSPFAVLALLTYYRRDLIPNTGGDFLSPLWLKNIFVFGFHIVIICVVFVLTMGVSILGRFSEFGIAGLFGERVPYIVEAELAVEKLMRAVPQSAGDIEAFANAFADTDSPIRLASASLSGGALSFASEALEEGRVAKAVEVRSDDGTFIFDIDRYYSGLSIIDTSNTAFFWACIVALYLAAAVAARVLLISPLESMLSALTSAASVLDDDGVPVDSSSGIPGHKTPPNLEATVRRLLALVSRVTRSDATGRGDSFLERFGGIRVSDKEAGDEEGSVIGRRFRSGTESGDGSPRAGKLVDDGASKALARMRFPPAVLNGLGTPMWKPGRLCQETMVSACHLMFVKSRIPESLCSREAFVAWTNNLLLMHPVLPFHNSRRAIMGLHAAFSAMRLNGFSSLTPSRIFPVLVASVAANVGAVGLLDEDLEETGHPLGIKHGFNRPQIREAAAKVFEAAKRGSDSDIFAALGKDDRRIVQDRIIDCLAAASPEEIPWVTREVLLLAGTSSMIKAETMTRGGKKSAKNDASLTRTARRGLMRALVAISSVHHVWGPKDVFEEQESKFVDEQKGAAMRDRERRALESGPGVGEALGEEVQMRRNRFWHHVGLPLVQALARVDPFFAGAATAAEANLASFKPADHPVRLTALHDRDGSGTGDRSSARHRLSTGDRGDASKDQRHSSCISNINSGSGEGSGQSGQAIVLVTPEDADNAAAKEDVREAIVTQGSSVAFPNAASAGSIRTDVLSAALSSSALSSELHALASRGTDVSNLMAILPEIQAIASARSSLLGRRERRGTEDSDEIEAGEIDDIVRSLHQIARSGERGRRGGGGGSGSGGGGGAYQRRRTDSGVGTGSTDFVGGPSFRRDAPLNVRVSSSSRLQDAEEALEGIVEALERCDNGGGSQSFTAGDEGSHRGSRRGSRSGRRTSRSGLRGEEGGPRVTAV